MRFTRSYLLTVVLLSCALSSMSLIARAQNDVPPMRTGNGGSNQAAGPSGQHPGQIGAIDPQKVAVFDFQLANLGQQPPTDADFARLPHLSDMLRKLLADSGRYAIVPITDEVKTKVAKAAELRSCGGCAVDFARSSGRKLRSPGRSRRSRT